MKKTNSLFISVLIILASMATVTGKDAPRNAGLAVVPVKGSEIIKVIYKSEQTGRIKLNVYNVRGRLIFSETVNDTDGFILPLNFGGLESGEYMIELTDGLGKRVEKVNYLPVQSHRQVHISKIVNAKNKFLVSVVHATNEKINVKIYDSFDNLLYSETKQVEHEFAQLYTVKNVDGVTIEVSDDAGNFVQERF